MIHGSQRGLEHHRGVAGRSWWVASARARQCRDSTQFQSLKLKASDVLKAHRTAVKREDQLGLGGRRPSTIGSTRCPLRLRRTPRPPPDRRLGPDPIAPRSSAAPTKPWTMPSLRAPTAQSRRGPSSAWGPAPSGGARNNKNEEPMGRSSLGANRGSRSRPFDYPLKQYPSVIRVPNTSGHWIPLLQVQSDSVLSLGLENLILSSTPPA